MTRARTTALLAVTVTGLVGGCGSATTSPTGAATPAPSSGATPSGTALVTSAFSTVVPAGWDNKLGDAAEVQKFAVNGKVLLLVEQGPPGQLQHNVNDVKANVNVLLLSPSVPDNQIPAYLQTVSSSGATNLSAPQTFTIDGSTGQFITYDRDISGTPGEIQDMIVNHGGSTYDIILNTSQFAFAQQLAGLQAILAAWKWAA